MERLLTTKELAHLMTLSEASVRRKARMGELPSIKCGRSKKAALRFDFEEVLRHLKDARALQHCNGTAR